MGSLSRGCVYIMDRVQQRMTQGCILCLFSLFGCKHTTLSLCVCAYKQQCHIIVYVGYTHTGLRTSIDGASSIHIALLLLLLLAV